MIKNVIGWLLVLTSPVIGAAIPGPGGIPLFLIGFALVSFPGKRKMTSRILRGRPYDLASRGLWLVLASVALLFPTVGIWIFHHQVPHWWDLRVSKFPWNVLIAAFATFCVWLMLLALMWLANRLIIVMPRGRRLVRPWMRRKGIYLLPPRRRRRIRSAGQSEDLEILEVDAWYGRKAKSAWKQSLPWIKRGVGVAITGAIFAWMLRPVYRQWDVVRDRAGEIDPLAFGAAIAMFTLFLLVFRAMAWWRIVLGFGHRLPIPATLRIWTTSELARYIPGAIWQVVGRVYLVKPYGVSGSVCSTTQILEITTFLLANIIVAVLCLLYYFARLDPYAKPWFIALMALVPLLGVVLHPKIFYRVVNKVLVRLGKPPIVQRLRGKWLVGILVWSVIGLLWQSLAVWLVTRDLLELDLAKWWVVAGSYCLAWCAGFLAIWAPGGIGVRELVFMSAMAVALPERVTSQFDSTEALAAFLAFLSVLLRLWATGGEILLAAAAYSLDFKAAMTPRHPPGVVSPAGASPACGAAEDLSSESGPADPVSDRSSAPPTSEPSAPRAAARPS